MKKMLFFLALLSISFSTKAQTSAPQVPIATDGTLAVTFTTNNAGSGNKFSAAIYIQNSSNILINTMLYNTGNGDGSALDLTTWWSLIGSAWPSTLKLTTTDATTGATLSTHYSNKVIYWGKTASVATVADGTYKVNFEIVNYLSSPIRRYYSGTFVKGPAVSSSTVTATLGYSGITITWTPVSSAINDVEFEKLYNVYPNPAVSSIYVSGSDITEVEICSLAGKSLIVSKEQQVNVSKLPKGMYLAVVRAEKGTIVRKIEKL